MTEATPPPRPLATWRPRELTTWQRFCRNPAQFVAQYLYKHRAAVRAPPKPEDAISVVCISDTHGTKPDVPDGDLLLHAGDLSIAGTFDELQAQLDWINTLPHRHKVVIAGNHDLLLDPVFVARSPDRICEGEGTSRGDLDWGTITYLCDASASLAFPNGRVVAVYGSPRTPMFGSWAFQYPGVRVVWPGSVPAGVDVLLTHGPPRGHLDGGGGKGCPQLMREVARARPGLVVFGHIHAARGQELVRYDRVQEAYDRIMGGDGGLRLAVAMLFWLVVGRLGGCFGGSVSGRTSTLVNAAVVGSSMDHVEHHGTVVNI